MLISKYELSVTGADLVLKSLAGKSAWGRLPISSIWVNDLGEHVLIRSAMLVWDTMEEICERTCWLHPEYVQGNTRSVFRQLVASKVIPDYIDVPEKITSVVIDSGVNNSMLDRYDFDFMLSNLDLYLHIDKGWPC